MPSLRNYIVEDWSKGLVTRVEGEAKFPKGAAEDSLNWQTEGDHIELRRGQATLGASIAGAGRVTGLKVARNLDAAQTQRIFYSEGRKLRYYDASAEDFVEISSDLFPSAADGEDIAIEEYSSLGGAFVFVSSPNSGLYKASVANPGSYVDLKSHSFKGKIRIKNGSMYLWDRKDSYGGSDKTGLYRSWLDKDELSDYAYVDKEAAGTGNGVLTSFSGDLDQIVKSTAANEKRTAMFVRFGAPIGAAKVITAITRAASAQVTSAAHGLSVGQFVTFEGVVGMTEINGRIGFVSSVVDANNFAVDVNSSAFTAYVSDGTCELAETFTDGRDGTLSGHLGGTGTINYVTGAYSLTASAAVTNAKSIYAEYYYEDSSNSDSGTTDSGAIADFSKSVPREALEGFTIRQDDGGGPFQNLFYLGDDDYCVHVSKTWRLTLSADDTDAVNKPYRERVGIEYWRGGQETSQGILYVDSIDQSDAYVKRLELDNISGLAEPKILSDLVSFLDYRFDRAVVFEYGRLILVACRHKDSTANDTVFAHNKLWKSWDRLDYRISCADKYNGSLIAGDSGSKNVFTLFSGLTDEESNIPNQWTSGNTDLDAEGIKSVRKGLLAGLIGPDQEYDFQLSLDNGPFVTYATIRGDGDYVDRARRVLVGPNTIGTEQIGGGGDGIEAYHYRREFAINTDKFEKIRYRFVARAVGYVSVAEMQFKDVRYKGRRAALKYVSEPGT